MNWQKGVLSGGEVSIQMPRYKYHYRDLRKVQQEAIAQVGKPPKGEAIFMRRSIAQDWACEANKNKVTLTEDTLLEEYKRHAKVFSKEESKCFPPEREEDMSIKFKHDIPASINCKVYPLMRAERDLLQKFLATELELGRIQEGPSPYTSPVYFINKKDSEEKRIIIDYRKINKWTVRNNNPLPNIREALENFRGKGLFSKFDIRWRYNNICLKEEDKHKAAFKTNFGTYIPQVMYSGLTNAPPFFQRVMHRDFWELLQQYPENLGNYMDDWWIATNNTLEGIRLHRRIVHAFLDQMERKSYFLKASKTQFERPQIELLGWLVSKEGIKIDPSKVSGIADWPRELRSVKEVQETLGMLGYQ